MDAEYILTFDPQHSGYYGTKAHFDLIIIRDEKNYPWASFHQDMLWKNEGDEGREFLERLHAGEKLKCKVSITVISTAAITKT